MTWLAVVGDGLPDVLAEGAAIGMLAAAKSDAATGCLGMRIPTLDRPAVTLEARLDLEAMGRTNVSGPGHNDLASNKEGGDKD